ncbi:MAG: hypothetical protein J6Q37_04430 [Bacteroidales bacterium]|nr:hypothetical protein [Bacteroidales bacterium]
MKRNIVLFVAAAFALLSMASCNRKVEYQYNPYATLYHSSFTVSESAGEFNIPVLIQNATGADVQVAVKIDEGKALDGVDYEVISPANGILSFSGETDSLSVVVKIYDTFVGEFTGSKDFNVSISSASEGLSVGVITNARVMIDDVDHPLAAWIGSWTGEITGFFGNWPKAATTINISANPDGDPFTDLIVDGGINPYFQAAAGANPDYSAVVEGNQLIIASDQPCGYSDVVLLGFNAPDPNSADSYDHARFELQENGSLKLLNAYGAYTPSGGGFYEIYLGGAVFTKQ